MDNKKIILFLNFDKLHGDYRSFKTSSTFFNNGFIVKNIAFTHKGDRELDNSWGSFNVTRLTLPVLPLKIQMLIFWIKVIVKALFMKYDYIYSHDIFPLFPAWFLSKIRRVPYFL